MVTVLAGGQHADHFGASLMTLGCTTKGDRYVGPDPAQITGDDMKIVYAMTFAQVRPDGFDVVIGSPSVRPQHCRPPGG